MKLCSLIIAIVLIFGCISVIITAIFLYNDEKEIENTTPEPERNWSVLLVDGFFKDKNGWILNTNISNYTISWTIIDLPVKRSIHRLAVMGNQLYVVGGQDLTIASFPSISVYIYDLNTKAWRNGPSLNVRRAAFGMANSNKALFVCAGMIENSNPIHSCETLAIGSDNWTLFHGPGLANLFAPQMVYHDNFLYLFGGSLNFDWDKIRYSTNEAFKCDTNSKNWSRIAPLNQGRYFHAAVVHHNSIITCGGQSLDKRNETVLLSCESYSFESNKWILIPPLTMGNNFRYLPQLSLFSIGKMVLSFRPTFPYEQMCSNLPLEIYIGGRWGKSIELPVNLTDDYCVPVIL